MHNNLITLSSGKKMRAQLCTVNSNEWHRLFLYQEISKAAGQQKGPHGVVGLIMDAIDVCTVGMPILMAESIRKQVPDFIDAIVIDEGVRREAKMLFERARLDKVASLL